MPSLLVLLLTSLSALASCDLGPMVPMFQKWQMQSAPAIVDKVAAQGHRSVQFCITLQGQLDAEKHLQSVGLYRENREDPTEPNAYYPCDADIIAEIKGYCLAAFARAAEHKLRVSVLLHLNSHGEHGTWRNFFLFDPLAELPQSPSYQDAFILPVLQALEETQPADSAISFSLQGEMGATVFTHPASWQSLLKSLKERQKLPNAHFGLSFNFNQIPGGIPNPAMNPEALRSLWNDCDFIGVSMYQSVSAQPVAQDFDLALGLFVGDFNGMGCPLPEDKAIHFVEVGLGGGGRDDEWQNHIPALTPAHAARAPYLGSPKSSEADPWTAPAMKSLRLAYHEALCEFLARPRERYPIPEAFLWSFGSWDPLGLEDEAFADPRILALLKSHNARLAQEDKETAQTSPIRNID